MTDVLDKREKFARKREAAERVRLNEVSARVNHDASLRVLAGQTSSKTLHHGCDLCGMIAKMRMLSLQYNFAASRFMYGRCASGGVLLVHMPDTWYCLCDWDDFVYPMAELPEKILETAVKLGVWEAADGDA